MFKEIQTCAFCYRALRAKLSKQCGVCVTCRLERAVRVPPKKPFVMPDVKEIVVAWHPGETILDLKDKLIVEALRLTNGNRTLASKLLNISVRSMRDHIKDGGLCAQL